MIHTDVKKYLSCTLAVVLAAQTYSSQALTVTIPKLDTHNTLKYSGVALVAAGALRFFTREGDNLPSRFDWDQVAQGNDLLNQGKFFLDDELLGHAGSRPFDVINKENGRVERVNAYYPKGLAGWTATYYKSVLSALGATWLTVTAARLLALRDTTVENFVPRLANEISLQIKALGLNPAFEVFVPTLAAIIGYNFANAAK